MKFSVYERKEDMSGKHYDVEVDTKECPVDFWMQASIFTNFLQTVQNRDSLPALLEGKGKLTWKRQSPFRYEMLTANPKGKKIIVDLKLTPQEIETWLLSLMGKRPYILLEWGRSRYMPAQFIDNTVLGEVVFLKSGFTDNGRFMLVGNLPRLTDKDILFLALNPDIIPHIVGKEGVTANAIKEYLNTLPGVALKNIQVASLEKVGKRNKK